MKLEDIRDLALMDSCPIGPLACRPVSIRTYVLLKQCGSQFILGGTPTPADLGIYLWFHSPGYCIDARARAKFLRGVRRLLRPGSYLAVCQEVDLHLARSFFEAPATVKPLAAHGETVAGLVDLLAREYGWADEQILRMPIGRAFMYRAMILHRLQRRPA